MINARYFQTAAFIAAIVLIGCAGKVARGKQELADTETASGESEPFSFAGKYLASHFAQNQYDWETAGRFIDDLLSSDPQNTDLLRRSMILATGSGDIPLAAERAKELTALAPQEGDDLAILILTVNDMAGGRMKEALSTLEKMKSGDMTDFVKPVLKGWAQAGLGIFDTEGFNGTSIHNYHGALLASFLGKKEDAAKFTQALIGAGTLSNADAERTADMLALSGRFNDAKTLYQGIYAQDDGNRQIAEKLAEVEKKDGGKIRALTDVEKIKKPQQGAALALYDMAYILYQEHSDSSTKLFANLALALDPAMTDARLLLADTQRRNGRLDEALAQLGKVPPEHPSYLAVQRYAAEILSEAGRDEEARQKLDQLFTAYNDVESLIRIGDLYRSRENYSEALDAYNRAATQIGAKIPEKYWYLLYARGMAYERDGDWQKAESDLKAALVYRPDHPYLLNYLGYGWADQGLNLDQSLDLIKRAVTLQPTDGYIIDSLGWVQYRMGAYGDALPNLERAVELLPYDSTINDHLGDAYWRAGRKTEARYQWQRALNYSEKEEESLQERVNRKLRFGLEAPEDMKQAGAQPE